MPRPTSTAAPSSPTTPVLLPAFRGRLDPDVAFCGFALDLDEARGTPGWWFVVEQQPTEPRFGLDVAVGFGTAAGPVNEWNDLTWGHLADNAAALAALTHLRTDLRPRRHRPGHGGGARRPRWPGSSSSSRCGWPCGPRTRALA